MDTKTLLADKRVLVVEDEFFLADDLCRDLGKAGAVVLGPVPSVRRALDLIDAEPAIHVAILDASLGGEMAFPVADALLKRGYPFVFTTGYSEDMLTARYPGVPCIEKPVDFRQVAKALDAAMAGTA